MKSWRAAVSCWVVVTSLVATPLMTSASVDFELPHLMLGYAAALARDVGTAKAEWIAVLEGGNAVRAIC